MNVRDRLQAGDSVVGALVRRLRPSRSYEDMRERLLKRLPKRSVGCEVGVWKGGFSARILDVVQPAELHLIDPWLFMPEYADSVYGGLEAGSQADMDAIYQAVADRFRNKPGVHIHRLPSTEAAASFQDGSLDWVYIDGCHLYEYVAADLEAFAVKVRTRGLLCGDDYGTPGWWEDGVHRAVDEFLADRDDFSSVHLGDQFALRKR